MNLILVKNDEIRADGTVLITDGYRLKSINSILKSHSSDSLRTGILNGAMGNAEIVLLKKRMSEIESIVLNVGSLSEEPPEALNLTLICAMQRPKTLKKVIQSATALGVKSFYIIETWKVEKSYWTSSILDERELEKQFLLGLEQCGDTIMPQIHIRRKFKPFVEDELPAISKDTAAFVAHPNPSKQIFSFDSSKAITLAVGPEGGFTEYEVNKLRDAGFGCVSLGERTLRTEFAVTALVSILTIR